MLHNILEIPKPHHMYDAVNKRHTLSFQIKFEVHCEIVHKYSTHASCEIS